MSFQPLLACTIKPDVSGDVDLQRLSYPLYWSPKIDGVRTIVREEDQGPVTRKLKMVPNQNVFKDLSDSAFYGFDGESIFGDITDKKVFNATQSAIMKIGGPSYREANGRLLVFDDFSYPDDPFEVRYERLKARVAALTPAQAEIVKLVPHGIVENDIQLANIERVLVEKGYEGVMLRSMKGRYKFGRSTLNEMILAKLKRFSDCEAVIVGFEELEHNDNEAFKDELGHTKRQTLQENKRGGGTLGALRIQYVDMPDVRTPDGKAIVPKVGTGFDAALRQEIWDNQQDWLGQTIVVKYQPSGMKDLPRFPVFKGLRSE